MSNLSLEDRIELAVKLFKVDGYNCAQAVTTAFATLYGLTEEQALRVSASFGGGMGRMREVCGAASALFILAGLQCGSTEPHDDEGKGKNYAVVQQLAAKFKERNGSIICGELLGLRPKRSVYEFEEAPTTPQPRTQEYYQKRPCVSMVREAATIWAEYIRDLEKPLQENRS